jgi:hypothetical protein
MGAVVKNLNVPENDLLREIDRLTLASVGRRASEHFSDLVIENNESAPSGGMDLNVELKSALRDQYGPFIRWYENEFRKYLEVPAFKRIIDQCEASVRHIKEKCKYLSVQSMQQSPRLDLNGLSPYYVHKIAESYYCSVKHHRLYGSPIRGRIKVELGRSGDGGVVSLWLLPFLSYASTRLDEFELNGESTEISFYGESAHYVGHAYAIETLSSTITDEQSTTCSGRIVTVDADGQAERTFELAAATAWTLLPPDMGAFYESGLGTLLPGMPVIDESSEQTEQTGWSPGRKLYKFALTTEQVTMLDSWHALFYPAFEALASKHVEACLHVVLTRRPRGVGDVNVVLERVTKTPRSADGS